jgi:hypothetical protein
MEMVENGEMTKIISIHEQDVCWTSTPQPASRITGDMKRVMERWDCGNEGEREGGQVGLGMEGERRLKECEWMSQLKECDELEYGVPFVVILGYTCSLLAMNACWQEKM